MIFIFKTTVHTFTEAAHLEPLLQEIISPTGSWNFDLEDCDRILKINGPAGTQQKVIHLLNGHGFVCEELAD